MFGCVLALLMLLVMAAHAAYTWRAPRRAWMARALWADGVAFLGAVLLVSGNAFGLSNQQLDEIAKPVLFAGVLWLILVSAGLFFKARSLKETPGVKANDGI